MTEIGILNQLINDNAKLSITDKHGKGVVCLIEPDAPDSSVIVSGLPLDAIVFKADAFPAPILLFANTRKECKRADYVIVSELDANKFIIYIEMKRTTASELDIIAQLKGATCVMSYCKAIVDQFWDRGSFLGTFKARYVYFGRTNVSVRKESTTIRSQKGKNDIPERVLKLYAQNQVNVRRLMSIE